MSTPHKAGTLISDIEKNLGEITPEEHAMARELRDAADIEAGRPGDSFEARKAQDERINTIQSAVLEDISFAECVIQTGALR